MRLKHFFFIGALLFFFSAQTVFSYVRINHAEVFFTCGIDRSAVQVTSCGECVSDSIRLPEGAVLEGDNFRRAEDNTYYPYARLDWYDFDFYLLKGSLEGNTFYIFGALSEEFPFWQNPVLYWKFFLYFLLPLGLFLGFYAFGKKLLKRRRLSSHHR